MLISKIFKIINKNISEIKNIDISEIVNINTSEIIDIIILKIINIINFLGEQKGYQKKKKKLIIKSQLEFNILNIIQLEYNFLVK